MNHRTDGDFHTDFIGLLARRMQPTLYVELGLGPEAATIRHVAKYCKRAIGVDTVAPPHELQRGYEFWQRNTQEFLKITLPIITKSSGLVDLAFIDADHSAEASFRDFKLLLPHMAPHGIILMHDTYPENESYLDPGRCGDCWQTARHLSIHAIEHGIEVVTLPTPPGLTIIRKVMGQHLRWDA